jgi:hypothetical protein
MDETGSGSCSTKRFVERNIEPQCSALRILIIGNGRRTKSEMVVALSKSLKVIIYLFFSGS